MNTAITPVATSPTSSATSRYRTGGRGPVIANMSMSLDGFVADPNGGVAEVFAWCTAGTETTTTPGDREFRTSDASAELLREAMARIGALVCGRRLFDLTHGWSGCHPTGAPVYVVTRQPPSDWPHDNATF
jgi:dihydrofolate reductase